MFRNAFVVKRECEALFQDGQKGWKIVRVLADVLNTKLGEKLRDCRAQAFELHKLVFSTSLLRPEKLLQ